MAIARYVPRMQYPTGWQTTTLPELAQNLYRYGEVGRPGVASMNFAIPGASERATIDLTPPATETTPPALLGAQGDAGSEDIQPPSLGNSIAPMDGLYERSDRPGSIYNPDGTFNAEATLGALTRGDGGASDNPLNSAGLSSPNTQGSSLYRPPTTGVDRSTEAQTQRYYDRKFAKMSRDPVVRTFARRIDARAPNVSRPVNPVRFNNDVAGHSDWTPY